eukprot:scaffold109775_cov57-Phaeocystis_antarctica.AAC.3
MKSQTLRKEKELQLYTPLARSSAAPGHETTRALALSPRAGHPRRAPAPSPCSSRVRRCAGRLCHGSSPFAAGSLAMSWQASGDGGRRPRPTRRLVWA